MGISANSPLEFVDKLATIDDLQLLYALLADLQNTISPSGGSSGYGSLNGSGRKQQQQHHQQVHHQQGHHQQGAHASTLPRATTLSHHQPSPDYATVNTARTSSTVTTTTHHHHQHHHTPAPPSTGSLHRTPSLSLRFRRQRTGGRINVHHWQYEIGSERRAKAVPVRGFCARSAGGARQPFRLSSLLSHAGVEFYTRSSLLRKYHSQDLDDIPFSNGAKFEDIDAMSGRDGSRQQLCVGRPPETGSPNEQTAM
ncbi:hypothetical protein AAG570_010119 [Ranatra chinensis]|uniref:Uncharacterized protein n=1 Tax=Ranatra chinensis TaxID=642074 RepID=A0ABD0YXT2_9HEMI